MIKLKKDVSDASKSISVLALKGFWNTKLTKESKQSTCAQVCCTKPRMSIFSAFREYYSTLIFLGYVYTCHWCDANNVQLGQTKIAEQINHVLCSWERNSHHRLSGVQTKLHLPWGTRTMYFIIPLLEGKKVHSSHFSYPYTYSTIISDTSSLAWQNYYSISIWASIHCKKEN